MSSSDRIVLIDDDRVVGEIVSALAKAMSLQCDVTRTPEEFFDRISPETSVILLDLVMPEMDGIEILRLLGERNCKARIILMSGINIRVIETAKKLAQSLGLSVIGHLQKPFPIAQLQELLGATMAPERPAELAETQLDIPDADILRALDENEFVLYYQPQINIATGIVTGVEALSRWQHPKLGLVFPDNFISRIEDLGLMDRFCWITAERALNEVRQFSHASGYLPRLAINVSVSSLRDLKFPDIFMNLARKYDFPAERIVLEITESGLMEFSLALDVLTRLRMRNFQLSIDDFGTGYSMMKQLQNVPAIELKIDRTFIEHMHANHADLVMVEKIIEMGHELEMEVIAEGVETEEQFKMLRERGCDGVQGYFFSRALPPHEILRWLETYRTQNVN
ncbi:MAG TPA: EAL domain-containing response regulator [Terracidiphilus sp.]|jgi:EAL domain-containing protein (putative c-di-GMP-specific phosphodiesterase class I)/CheY-like chemotaxis protein